MSRIAVLITDMYEDVEFSKPAGAFEKAGHELVRVGLHAGSTVRGKNGTMVAIDRAVKDVRSLDFDALFVPGGYSPDKLRADPDAVDFVRDFMQEGKPVLVICHGPQILITAQVLAGRRLTGWKSIAQDIRNAGAEYSDEKVVIDRNLVSSRKPDDIPAFIRASLRLLEKGRTRDRERALSTARAG